MARRKQLKGVAGNIGQWCLSRNFDYEGYWALGQFFVHAEANGTEEIVIKVIEEFVPIHAEGIKFSSAIKLLSGVLKRDIISNNIPDWWLKDVSVIFRFNASFEHKYHYWGSGLGGKPFMCVVNITTDLGKTYSKESGCNVWVHNPKREQRRYGF
jgi:hypothetical protein